jgi:hypothetical protein
MLTHTRQTRLNTVLRAFDAYLERTGSEPVGYQPDDEAITVRLHHTNHLAARLVFEIYDEGFRTKFDAQLYGEAFVSCSVTTDEGDFSF